MKVYYSYTSDFTNEFFEKAFEFLPEEKKKAITELKNSEAKKESTLGWYLFSLGCNELEIKDRRLEFGEKGKPGLKSGEYFFNISHSSGLVGCAFAKSSVGFDSEKIKPCSEGVIKRVLCPNELEKIKVSAKKEADFIKFWTMKECILKQNGQGIGAGLKNFDFSPYLKKDEFRFQNLNFITRKIGEHICTVCSMEDECEFIKIEPNHKFEGII